MDIKNLYESKKRSLDEFLNLIQPKDRLCTSIAAGQPRALLNHLSNKSDLESLHIFTGLIAFPYPLFAQPNVFVTSGYYGLMDRMLNEMGANIAYLPLAFTDFEIYAEQFNPRVVMTTLSSMDEEGYLSFGVNSEASYIPFIKAARDPNKLAIAEVNPQMPRVQGISKLGGNKIHISEIDYFVEAPQSILEVIPPPATEEEKQIAAHVASLIRTGDTLQFGIGAIPNEVASLLAQGSLGNFGVHSELISDGFMSLMESGKITNTQKGFNDGASIFTFALGSQKLYHWLDEAQGKNQGRAIAAPVSYVNDPHIIAKNKNMVSINSGFMIDMAGQVCSEAIGERQYSGVGGQLNFIQGALHSEGGRSILCIKSSVELEGKRYSNIVESFPIGSIVSTPRHYVQIVVTEYGSIDLYGLSDEERPYEMIKIAHPDFRERLLEEAKKRDQSYYRSKRGV
ncbi:MAG: acetyl-CoA hydrolase/transferase family protein [Deltaproteobacteria bacterium]|nr:acetyl-CoA hydrolase/transferase family protein [Deltaproteobacteria bacterium]